METPPAPPTTPPLPWMRKKESALWGSAVRYFRDNPDAWRTVNAIVGRTMGAASSSAAPSLRCISYYVSSYTRTNRTVVPWGEGGGGGNAPSLAFGPNDVHSCYRQMLKIHTKHRFDPFCRRDRAELSLHGTALQTNVGQLVFFRWFIRSGALRTLERDHDDVMRTRLAEIKARRSKRSRSQSQPQPQVAAARGVEVKVGSGPAERADVPVGDAAVEMRFVVRPRDAGGAHGARRIRIAMRFD